MARRTATRSLPATPVLERIEVSSWDHFMGKVAAHLDGGWLFRGVSRTSFTLVPSIGRHGDSAPTTPREEELLLDRFKREARPYLTFQPVDNWEWLAIAQHHGVPTRLIDWSETPLIAAYFAVQDANDDKYDGGVYMVRRPQGRNGVAKRGPFASREVHFFYPGHVTRRITAQRGLFTVHPNPMLEYAPNDARQFVIHQRLKAEFRVKLDGLGVNYASVFPDIDGLSRHLAWTFRRIDHRAVEQLAREKTPLAERLRFDPEDPQKGKWGGQSSSNGWELSAKVGAEQRGWYPVTLTVKPTGRKRLRKPVTFHLHPTFTAPVRTARPAHGVAEHTLWAYGAFTVGAEVSQDRTKLELNLAELEGAPKGFRKT